MSKDKDYISSLNRNLRSPDSPWNVNYFGDFWNHLCVALHILFFCNTFHTDHLPTQCLVTKVAWWRFAKMYTFKTSATCRCGDWGILRKKEIPLEIALLKKTKTKNCRFQVEDFKLRVTRLKTHWESMKLTRDCLLSCFLTSLDNFCFFLYQVLCWSGHMCLPRVFLTVYKPLRVPL